MSGHLRAETVAALGVAAAMALCPLQAADAAGREHHILIKDMAFSPGSSTIRRGDVIIWENQDIFVHTATARDHSSDIELQPGSEGRTTITRPGMVEFYCRFHPGMTARVSVVP